MAGAPSFTLGPPPLPTGKYIMGQADGGPEKVQGKDIQDLGGRQWLSPRGWLLHSHHGDTVANHALSCLERLCNINLLCHLWVCLIKTVGFLSGKGGTAYPLHRKILLVQDCRHEGTRTSSSMLQPQHSLSGKGVAAPHKMGGMCHHLRGLVPVKTERTLKKARTQGEMQGTSGTSRVYCV